MATGQSKPMMSLGVRAQLVGLGADERRGTGQRQETGPIRAHTQLLWALVGSLCVHLWLQDLTKGVRMAAEAAVGVMPAGAKAQLEGTALSLRSGGVRCGGLCCHLALSLLLSPGLDVSEGSGL